MITEPGFAALLERYYYHAAIALLLLIAAWEMLRPARAQHFPITVRWAQNFGLTVLNIAIGSWLQPALGATAALLAAALGSGLFNRVELPFPVVMLGSLLALDLGQYLAHRLLHAIPLGWRIHRVHHCDLDLDLSTGFRFHPFEAVVTAIVQVLVIALLGVPAAVVLVRALLVFWVNLFSHGNIRLPPRLERALRWVFVTPGMHALHHSDDARDGNSNFGSLLSVWDRLFGSYRERDAGQPASLGFGIPEFRDWHAIGILQLLLMPFRRPAGDFVAPPRDRTQREDI